jgi:hypothetical protein
MFCGKRKALRVVARAARDYSRFFGVAQLGNAKENS